MTQLITYPSFLKIDKNEFVSFHNKYVKNISIVAVPTMSLELLTLVYMNVYINNLLFMKSLLVLIVIWLVTFIIIVPIHNQLSKKLEIEKISTILESDGNTIVNINLVKGDNILQFRLKNPRKFDRKSLNILRNQEIQAIIN